MKDKYCIYNAVILGVILNIVLLMFWILLYR